MPGKVRLLVSAFVDAVRLKPSRGSHGLPLGVRARIRGTPPRKSWSCAESEASESVVWRRSGARRAQPDEQVEC